MKKECEILAYRGTNWDTEIRCKINGIEANYYPMLMLFSINDNTKDCINIDANQFQEMVYKIACGNIENLPIKLKGICEDYKPTKCFNIIGTI